MALDLSFKDLAEAASRGVEANGQPLRIPLDRIDEDPDQPRRTFTERELNELADSIREKGIIQPVVVRRGDDDGRYVLVVGGRRYRAAQRAGLSEIPAILQSGDETDRYAQMIENIQREDLQAPDIAAFVSARLEAGEKQADIARKLGKPRDWVSRYAAVRNMPEILQAKLANSSIRAVYEVFQLWREQPEVAERLCETRDSFTDAQARQLVRDLRTVPVGDDPGEHGRDERVRSKRADRGKDSGRPDSEPGTGSVSDQAIRNGRTKGGSRAPITIRVRSSRRLGQLIMDRPASKGSRYAVVKFDGADGLDEVAVASLRVEEILAG